MRKHLNLFRGNILILLILLLPAPSLAENIEAKLSDSDNTSSFQVKNSADTVLLDVQSGGNVGLDVTTPEEKLDVNGNVQISGTNGKLVFPSLHYDTKIELFKGGEEKIGTASHQLKLIAGEVSPANVGFFGGATEVMRVDTGSGNVGVGTTTPNSTLQLNGSFSLKYVSTSTDYTTNGDAIIGVNATGPVTVTLSDTDCVAGRIVYIKEEAGVGYSVTVDTEAGVKTIDGLGSVIISSLGALKLYSNGIDWFILEYYGGGG